MWECGKIYTQSERNLPKPASSQTPGPTRSLSPQREAHPIGQLPEREFGKDGRCAGSPALRAGVPLAIQCALGTHDALSAAVMNVEHWVTGRNRRKTGSSEQGKKCEYIAEKKRRQSGSMSSWLLVGFLISLHCEAWFLILFLHLLIIILFFCPDRSQ